MHTFRFPLCLGILSLFFSASTLAQSAAVSRSVVGDDVPSYDSSQVVAVASSSAPSASGSPPSPSGMAGPFNSTDPRGGRGPGGGSNGTDSPSIGDAAFAGNGTSFVRGDGRGGHGPGPGPGGNGNGTMGNASRPLRPSGSSGSANWGGDASAMPIDASAMPDASAVLSDASAGVGVGAAATDSGSASSKNKRRRHPRVKRELRRRGIQSVPTPPPGSKRRNKSKRTCA